MDSSPALRKLLNWRWHFQIAGFVCQTVPNPKMINLKSRFGILALNMTDTFIKNSFWLVQFFAEHHEHKRDIRAHNIAMDGLSWSSSIGERVLLPEGSEAPDWLHYQPVTLFEFAPLFAGLSEEKLLCESITEFSHVRLCFFLLIHLV